MRQKVLISSYGKIYPIESNIYDLRLLNNETTSDQKIWKHGQVEFEKMIDISEEYEHDETEIQNVGDVYKDRFKWQCS